MRTRVGGIKQQQQKESSRMQTLVKFHNFRAGWEKGCLLQPRSVKKAFSVDNHSWGPGTMADRLTA